MEIRYKVLTFRKWCSTNEVGAHSDTEVEETNEMIASEGKNQKLKVYPRAIRHQLSDLCVLLKY